MLFIFTSILFLRSVVARLSSSTKFGDEMPGEYFLDPERLPLKENKYLHLFLFILTERIVRW